MGRELAKTCPEARSIFDRADAVLDFDVARVCFEGPQEELDRTSVCQPAILAVSIAALEAWEAHGAVGSRQSAAGSRQSAVGSRQSAAVQEPQLAGRGPAAACAGLSLGEYTALVYAGALTFEDAVGLVRRRGQFMEDAARENPGGMLTLLGLERARVNEAVEAANAYGVAQVANINCPEQVVISGATDALEWLAQRAKDLGAMRAIRLKVAGAFHSRLMAPAAERLGRELEGVAISQPKAAVVSNVTAKYIRSASEIRELLVRQLTSPVLWEDSMRFLLAQGVRKFVEVGPGRVLSGLLGRIDPTAERRNIDSPDSMKADEPQGD